MSREVLQMALAVLKGCLEHPDAQDSIIAIEHELAQPDPLFAAPVAAQKWAALQDEGYKMQQLSFARDGVTGTIDDWGKVLWEPIQPEQEPVGFVVMEREWAGLTEDEINIIYAEPQTMIGQYARAIEAKLRSKNV